MDETVRLFSFAFLTEGMFEFQARKELVCVGTKKGAIQAPFLCIRATFICTYSFSRGKPFGFL